MRPEAKRSLAEDQPNAGRRPRGAPRVSTDDAALPRRGNPVAARLLAARRPLTFCGMIHSRLSTKAQTTVPRAVRVALGLREGDTLAYRIEGEAAILTRVASDETRDDPFATFTEWADDADQGYDVLGRG